VTEIGASSPSVPAYPSHRSGTVLICGYADTLFDDLARARKLRPDASVIAVNDAAGAVEAFAVFSLHCRRGKLDVWAAAQRKKFGPREVHSHGYRHKYETIHAAYPWVDYWWPAAMGTGTSAWAAAKMAKLMGFDEIILCGVTLERRPYANGRIARDFRHPQVLELYCRYIRNDKAWHEGVKAMSGWPRKFFGEPE